MKKINIIKENFGKPLKKYGFEYYKSEPNTWIFKREYQGVSQFINIFESNFEQAIRLELYTSANSFLVLEVKDFYPYYKNEYDGKVFWEYQNRESLLSILNKFVQIVIKYGINKLDELSAQNNKSQIQLDEKMHMKLLINHTVLCKCFVNKYEVAIDNIDIGLIKIIELVKENRNTDYEYIKNLLLEMASYYGEALIFKYGGKFKWDVKLKSCIWELIKHNKKYYCLLLDDVFLSWLNYDDSIEVDNYLIEIYNELRWDIERD